MGRIGVTLNKIFGKRSLLAHFAGFAYSTISTITPMVLIIIAIYVMGQLVGFGHEQYAARELFSCTVLYIFIFSLMTTSPLNAVLSRYMSDAIYEEKFEDLVPSYYMGLLINVVVAALISIPFFLHEYFVGKVELLFILLSAIGFYSLIFTFYTMLYLSIVKDFVKVTLFYGIGMLITVLFGVLFVKILHMEVIYGMLLALDIGMWLIGVLEFAQFSDYFQDNSRRYFVVLRHFRQFWPLVISNGLYIAGMYVHNFVFWTTDLKIVVVKSFICAEPYDMATFIAMLTNLTATVIFISNVEMRFHKKYKQYSEAILGGRLEDIRNSKRHMFAQLVGELMNLVRIQFIVTVIMFLVCEVFLPMIGIAGLVMQIYPILAAGYYLMFTMYAALLFLYYFNDLMGAMASAISFFITTLICSILATHTIPVFYGMGLFVGSLVGWSVAYMRLHWVEANMDMHTFCRGSIIPYAKKERPSDVVYYRDENIRDEHRLKEEHAV